jgi:hypothetical protein
MRGCGIRAKSAAGSEGVGAFAGKAAILRGARTGFGFAAGISISGKSSISPFHVICALSTPDFLPGRKIAETAWQKNDVPGAAAKMARRGRRSIGFLEDASGETSCGHGETVRQLLAMPGGTVPSRAPVAALSSHYSSACKFADAGSGRGVRLSAQTQAWNPQSYNRPGESIAKCGRSRGIALKKIDAGVKSCFIISNKAA